MRRTWKKAIQAAGRALGAPRWANRLARDRRGQDLIEYALIVGLIAVIIGAMIPNQLMPQLTQIWNAITSSLGDAPQTGS
jgi:Flp pilus assembly pilin Flp